MNQSSRWMYVVFALCAAAVLGALAFVTSHVLRLERRDVESRAAAKADESVRLALWRMDSAVNAIIAKEAARPYFEYQPFYAADRAYTKMFDDVRPGEVLVPSPLLLGSGDYVTLHFQRTPDGTITSPQVPTGNMRDLAESAYIDSTAVIAAEDHLRHLAALISSPDAASGRALAAGDSADKRPEPGELDRADGFDAERAPAAQVWRDQAQNEPEQAKREYEARSQSAELAASNVWQQRVAPPSRLSGRPAAPESTITSNRQESSTAGAKPDAQPGTLVMLDQAASATDALHPTLEKLKDTKAEAGESKPVADASIESAAPPSGIDIRDTYRKQVATPSTTSAPAPAPGGSAPGAPAARIPPVVAEPASDAAAESKRIDPTSRRIGRPSAVPLPGAAPADRSASFGTPLGGTPPLFALAYEPEPAINLSPFMPSWLGEPQRIESPRELIFTRTIHTASATLEQGLWIDWPRLASFLQSSAKDLVPGASVIPTSSATSADPTALARRLASIPAELRWTPPPVAVAQSLTWSPARTTLVLTWIATLIAIGAIAFVLHSSTDLAERRGRFVSAVTHELRTPLTTFCMYSQMLADGMVTSDDARRDYLQTLKQEASRLSRIVENVLDYARLGRKKKPAPPAPIAATDLLARMEPALRLRAEQSGMRLVIHAPGPSDASVRAEPATVERILYNLVDNACKYASLPLPEGGGWGVGSTSSSASPAPSGGGVTRGLASVTEGADATNNHASPPPIELSLTLSAHHATFSVRDQGPGIPESERAHIFKPFHRGPHHSDGSIPGLGLGLALARGLAQSLHGELRLHPTSVGTQLDLTLPCADT